MVTQDELNQEGKNAVTSFDDEAVEEIAEKCIKEGLDPVSLIQDGFTAGMNEVGDQFEKGIVFLPHVIAASDAMSAGVKVLTPVLEKSASKMDAKETVAIGTIEGDIHSIGKDIVATMLKIAGFNVIDLGRDVPIAKYVEAAKDGAQIIASSALMTTTMVLQMKLEEQLKEAGVRDKVKTMVGGAPATQDWADKIGADIYAEDSSEAVVKCKAILN
ncbi:Methionine synthase [Methanimicrococcus sp. At1]|uniref:Methionine synthase n=1 Tax=Methanimicrococcus hacksteinii TaxID=3028293 RepID=A0ABU3VQC0_9EURY|nr:B12-binding domain-containing protein [Methanimicrococcus sp. At1]MDV0445612.1 Methionine synthase [Methanimicrococcus sp. At1]